MRRRVAAFLSLAAILAFTLVGSPAVAAPPGPVKLLAATLLGRGAGVRLDFEISCAQGLFHDDFTFSVTQQTRRGATMVETRGDPGCVGGAQHVSFVAIPASGQFAFTKGVAVVRAHLTTCGAPTVCEGFPLMKTVRLHKQGSPPQPDYPDRLEVVSATLTPSGSVLVRLEVECRAGGLASGLEVRVAQRIRHRVYQASGGADPSCQNTAQDITVTILRPPDQPAFGPGIGLVAAEMFNFVDIGQFDYTRTQSNVRIDKTPNPR
jgi:hypothetical protein